MMIDAKYIREQIDAMEIVGLDEWMKVDVLAKFRQSWGEPVYFRTSDIKWPKKQFMDEMKRRGFLIEVEYGERPGEPSVYRIGI